MKKTLLLFLITVFLLTACSSTNQKDEKAVKEKETVTADQKKTVKRRRKKKQLPKYESLTLIPKDYEEKTVKTDNSINLEGVKIWRVHPLRVKPGTLVSIAGEGFGDKPASFTIGDITVDEVLFWNNEVIFFKLPEGVKDGDRVTVGDKTSNGEIKLASEEDIKVVWEMDMAFVQKVIDATAYKYDQDTPPKLVPPYGLKGQWNKSSEHFGDYDNGWSGGSVPMYNVPGTDIWKHEIYFTQKNFERFKKKIVYFAIEDSNNQDFGLSMFESNPAYIIKREWGLADDIDASDNDPGLKASKFSRYYIEKENAVYAVFPMPEYKMHNREEEEAKKEYLSYDISNLNVTQDKDSFHLTWDADGTQAGDKINIYSKLEGKTSELLLTVDSDTREADVVLGAFKPSVMTIKIENSDGLESRGVKSDKYTAILKNVVIDHYEGKEIHVYLPEGYETSGKKYKTMYMFDGQNLFSTAYAPNEWKIDEVVEKLRAEGKIEDTIVVGLFNAMRERGLEYIPYLYDRGVNFGNTLAKDITTYIESRYPAKTGRENRGVAGSSLGGLMTLYMYNAHSDEFSFFGAVSTYDPWGLEALKNSPKSDSVIWVDAGTGENASHMDEEGIEHFYSYADQGRTITDALMNKGYELGKNLYYFEVKDAIHNEIDWAQRVHNLFLLFNGTSQPKLVDMRLDIEDALDSNGEEVNIVNPVLLYDNGLEYSIYDKGEYSITGGSIDEKGVFTVDGEEATVKVKYADMEKEIKVTK